MQSPLHTSAGLAAIDRIREVAGLSLLCLLLLAGAATLAQAQTPVVQTQQQEAVFSQAELDQMLAPIALYPDALLSQVLMAATYPLEIVEAARWSRNNPGLEGEAAVAAAEGHDWDPSVIALVAFPELLARMDEDLDWTKRLGDAFLYQENQVVDTVQSLRQKAYVAGNLQEQPNIEVVREREVIYIEPAQTRIVHVPYYDPFMVYGPWWWPAYPPVHWAPYYWGGPRPYYSTTGFYWGTGIRIAPVFYFGAFDWHRRNVVIVKHDHYHRHRPGYNRVGKAPAWKHNPKHRRGVVYNNPRFDRDYGRGSASGRGDRPIHRDWRGPRSGSEGRPDGSRAGGNRFDGNRPGFDGRWSDRRDRDGQSARGPSSGGSRGTWAPGNDAGRDADRGARPGGGNLRADQSGRPRLDAPNRGVRSNETGSAPNRAPGAAGRFDGNRPNIAQRNTATGGNSATRPDQRRPNPGYMNPSQRAQSRSVPESSPRPAPTGTIRQNVTRPSTPTRDVQSRNISPRNVVPGNQASPRNAVPRSVPSRQAAPQVRPQSTPQARPAPRQPSGIVSRPQPVQQQPRSAPAPRQQATPRAQPAPRVQAPPREAQQPARAFGQRPSARPERGGGGRSRDR